MRYKPLFNESGAGYKSECSLNKIFFPGCYSVEIDHIGIDVGLPIDDCGDEHYIIGNLFVTDCGTMGPKQHNRVTGQVLVFTTRVEKVTKIYTRSFADGEWSVWRSLALTGMYDKIATTDELLASVEALVSVTKDTQNELVAETTRATEAEEALRVAVGVYSSEDNKTIIHLVAPYKANDTLRITLLANEQPEGYQVAVYTSSADGTLIDTYTRLSEIGSSADVVVPKDAEYITVRGAVNAHKTVRIENLGNEAVRAQAAESELQKQIVSKETILNNIAKGYIYSSYDNVTYTPFAETYKAGEILRITLLANDQKDNANVTVYGFENSDGTGSQKLVTFSSVGDAAMVVLEKNLNYISVRGVHLKFKSVRIESLSSRLLALEEYACVPCMFNPSVNLRKDSLKILDIGNSYTQDSHSYLKQLLQAAGIAETGFSLYKAVRGSASFYTWWQCYNDNDTAPYSISRTAGDIIEGIAGEGTAGDGSLFRNALTTVDWDIIIIHQVSNFAGEYHLWQQNNWRGSLREFIHIIRSTNPQACIGWLGVHSYKSNYSGNSEGSSLLRWENIVYATKLLRLNYGINFIIPYGTAVQNLRSCSLNDGEDFSTDGTHLASGLGDYVASCCYFQSLFAPRFGVSIVGNSYRIDVDETVVGQKSVTDTTAPVAQRAALLATCNMFEVQNPEE